MHGNSPPLTNPGGGFQGDLTATQQPEPPLSHGALEQEVNAEARTGTNNPPSTHHAQIALGLALTAEKQVLHHRPEPSASGGEGALPVQ